MKVSDFIAKFLSANGVTHVFELSGGMITHILDSLHDLGETQIISMHHEQSAAFAADAFGRVTGVPGVALATSGPGATNLLTGIGSCYFDSSPGIFITGQVNTYEQKGEKNIRQLGFQETDIVSVARPITKAAFAVKNAASIPSVFYEAFKIALSGRPGPVLIDIPMNIQRMEIEVIEIEKIRPESKELSLNSSFFNRLELDIKNSKNPLILVGRGIGASFAYKELSNFIRLTNIPVITSLLGLDAIEYENPLRVGFIGSYGNRWANLSIGECDLMIVLGSRLDIRQTGADTTSFKANKIIYHIDCESEELNNRLTGCTTICMDVKNFLLAAIHHFEKIKIDKKQLWLENIRSLKERWKDTDEIKECKGINPNVFIHMLTRKSKLAGCLIADVGSHQMWVAQSMELAKEQKFLTSGGMGAMGFALPAAIGSSFALNKRPVLAVIGDGSFQINIQELQTIVRNKLPIKIVILNNKSLGMIRQFQDSYFDSKYQSTVWGYDTPDFEKVAWAYGIDACTISEESQIQDGIQKLWQNPETPYLLHVMIDINTNAYPKIAFGKPITEMEPFFSPLDMEGT
jgi:acetolactate synthase-1/2/3 large subunit